MANVHVRYTVEVSITQLIEDCDEPQYWLTPKAKRDLERRVIRELTRIDGDTDCEVMAAEIVSGSEVVHG
jgi:hypothetical protein